MEAISHSAKFAKEAGVPQKVGKDFARADDKAGITKTHGGKPAKRTNGSSPQSAAEQMERRRGHGLTYRQVAKEHGVAASTAHRKVSLRRGFSREGSAND